MSKRSSRRPHRVALLVADGSNPFEMSVAMEVFGMPRPELDVPWYDFVVCGANKRVAVRNGLFEMAVPGTLRDAVEADTLIVPNRPDPLTGHEPEIIKAVAAAYRRGHRIVSFCTGAFTLAAAGILREHTVTTHWRWTEDFVRQYPETRLTADVLFVDDGQVLTAAGSAAALDLCLYLVRADYGAAIAQAVSRRLVFALHRDGGQQQFVPTVEWRGAETALSDVLGWAISRLDQPINVSTLATRAGLGVSTFHRQMNALVGQPPLVWLHRQRIDRAMALLESTDMGVEAIATAVGMGTATNLRTHFRRATSLSPTAYRQRFRSVDPLPN